MKGMISKCSGAESFLVISLIASCLYVVKGRIPTADEYLVRGLEDIEPAYRSFDGYMYAGLIPTLPFIDSKHKDYNDDVGRLMFWLFEPHYPLHDDTLVIWMNGGPGCSSFGGCLFEHCPVTLPLHPAGFFGTANDPRMLQPNAFSWTKATRMLYIEQPQGTGFSTGPFPDNEEDLSSAVYNFLQNLFLVKDNLRSKKLFIFGESYAGMYVPSIAHYIYKQNKANLQPYINLDSIGLGNGWMDASVQGPAVIDYAHWHGMIDSHTAEALHNEWIDCQEGKAVDFGRREYNGFHEYTIPDECGILGAVLEASGAHQVPWGSPNAYDVSTWDPYSMIFEPRGKMATFFNNPEVQMALNVYPSRNWVVCLPGSGRRRRLYRELNSRNLTDDEDLPGKKLLAHDQPESVIPYVADLLDGAGIRVLIYNGDRDMTTNSFGSEILLDKMEWSGKAGWSNPSLYERGLWLARFDPTTVGGYIKHYKNLNFLVVVNSGHLVPYNQPELALEMIHRFLGHESFIDKKLPSFDIRKGKVDTVSIITPEYNTSSNKTGNAFKGFFIALISFAAGVYASRRFADKLQRPGYEPVGAAEMT